MRSYRALNLRPQTLVIFLVALALLCSGARVPDLSRPHRPKPLHRVTVETPQKSPSNELKQQHHDVVALLPNIAQPVATIAYGAVTQAAPAPRRFPASIPHSGRAPPQPPG